MDIQVTQPISLDPFRKTIEKRGVSRSKQYKDVNEGLWTRPIKLSVRASAWPNYETEILNKAIIAGKSEEEIKALVVELETLRKSMLDQEAA